MVFPELDMLLDQVERSVAVQTAEYINESDLQYAGQLRQRSCTGSLGERLEIERLLAPKDLSYMDEGSLDMRDYAVE